MTQRNSPRSRHSSRTRRTKRKLRRHVRASSSGRRTRSKPRAPKLELETILIHGDLSALSVKQRLDYQLAVCKQLKISPLTKPFEWIWFKDEFQNDKPSLQMYATKNCTDQLRRIHRISTIKVANRQNGQYCISTVFVRDKSGRSEVATGVVHSAEGGQKFGDCIMWAETKAKRRATLSITGLGMLDETELHSLGEYGTLTAGGRIIIEKHPDAPGHGKTPDEIVAEKLRAAGVEPGVVFWIPNYENGAALIDGDPAVIAKLRMGVLAPYWRSRIGKFTVDAEELEVLRNKMAELEIPFRSRSADGEGEAERLN